MHQIPCGESAIFNHHHQKKRSCLKGHHPKARVSKKSSATQRARNEAMATRSTKKKLDLRKAVLTSMSNAIKQLHRTQHEKKPSFHQMPVCICCDNFIIGTERVHRIAKQTLKKYEPALGVKSYNAFHKENESLHPLLIRQYRVKGLDGMLLSPRANKNKKGYSICTSCYDCLRKKNHQIRFHRSLPSQMDLPLVHFPKLFLSLQDQEEVDTER